MAKYEDWVIDSEAADFAIKLQEKYDERLGHIDLTKVCFIREKNKKSHGVIAKTVPVKYPMDIDCPYIYYITINDNRWMQLDDAHKAVVLFEALCFIEVDGTDTQSTTYAKKQKPTINRFKEAIDLTNGAYDFDETIVVKDILAN
jgi:hypothetical protein